MDQQFTLRGQPAQRGMLQPGRGAALVVQVDRHAGDPEAVLRVAAQVQFGLVEPQLQQPRRQGQDAAPGQHRGYLGQGQHGIGRAVMDLDRSQIQPGIEPLPIGLDRADRNLCAQRLAGVGFYLRPPLVDAGQDPIAQAQQPDGGDAITASAPQYRPRSTFRNRHGSVGRSKGLAVSSPLIPETRPLVCAYFIMTPSPTLAPVLAWSGHLRRRLEALPDLAAWLKRPARRPSRRPGWPNGAMNWRAWTTPRRCRSTPAAWCCASCANAFSAR